MRLTSCVACEARRRNLVVFAGERLRLSPNEVVLERFSMDTTWKSRSSSVRQARP